MRWRDHLIAISTTTNEPTQAEHEPYSVVDAFFFDGSMWTNVLHTLLAISVMCWLPWSFSYITILLVLNETCHFLARLLGFLLQDG